MKHKIQGGQILLHQATCCAPMTRLKAVQLVHATQDTPLEVIWELLNPRSGAGGGPRHGQPSDAAAADGPLLYESQDDDDFLQHVTRILHAL